MGAEVLVPGGRVRGVRRAGVWAFTGVPYATTGAGPLRWRPPQPVAPWSGVLLADRFGPIAPQPPPVLGASLPGDPEDQDEDCLSLNVWTPAADDGRRPVMVWVHGGGFTTGTGAGLPYRGGDLARRGDVVVVTFNYRLGALGFLGHPVLAGRAGGAGLGNVGLVDQLAALRWVRQAIAGFGGDPANVTVFGESAGAMSIAALLGAPAARGLFHRAILQSGPAYVHEPARAATAGEDLFSVLGIASPSAEHLEAVPAADLVAATHELQSTLPRPGDLPLPFLPVVDGAFLPRHPLEAVAAGAAAGVPLVIGTTRDELALFAAGNPWLSTLDEAGVASWMARSKPGLDAPRAVATVRAARAQRGEAVTARDLWIAMGTDLIFRWPSLRLAAAHQAHEPRTFVYLFTQETPVFGGVLGSCHALDVPYVFGGVRRPAIQLFTGGGAEAEALSARMQAAWLAFARHGDPSGPGGPGEGAGDAAVPDDAPVPWDRWDPRARRTMVFGPGGGLAWAPRAEELAVWEEVDPLPATG